MSRFYAKLNLFLALLCSLDACSAESVKSLSASSEKRIQKDVLFIVGGGSHIHPTFETVKKLQERGALVTYLLFDKSSSEAAQLSAMGATVLSLSEELCKINSHFTAEQRHVLQNPWSNFVDQPEGIADTAILSQYFMALFWDELLAVIKGINPDVIVTDAYQGYWGKYVGRVLKIPVFVSFAPAFYYKEWKSPLFKDFVKSNRFKKVFPATSKRLWAVSYLHEKLGLIGNDIEVDFPVAMSDEQYATFIYTYPKFVDYQGERFLGTSLVFAGYPDNKISFLSQKQQEVVARVMQAKGNKKLIFISMGTDSSKPLEFFAMLGEALGNGGCNREMNKGIVVALHPGHQVAKGALYDSQTVSQYMQELGHTNFVVYDYFPLPYLFKNIDIFISHGGHNSAMQALKNYVPLLLLPIHGDQINVGEAFAELGFAKTVSDSMSPMKCKDDFDGWRFFASDTTKRAEFIGWIQQSVYELLDEVATPEKYEARKQKIDAMFQSNQGYDKIVELILSV